MAKKRKLDEDKFDLNCSNKKLNSFELDSITLAKNLLGKFLVRKIDNYLLNGRIVETEAYPGGDDKASHSYNNRRTKRCEPMYMKPGTTYVYFTYGMYYCFNISSKEPGGAVLIRALEPIEGIDRMTELRFKNRKKPNKLKLKELCNGPAKLCMSLNIDKELNQLDLTSDTQDSLWIEDDSQLQNDRLNEDDKLNKNEIEIIESRRIGIDSSGDEAVNKLYRFYIYNNQSVSKIDRINEKKKEILLVKK